MELFDDIKPAPGSPLDFHINGKISVREESGSVEVKYGFLPLAKFTRSDWAEVYQAAVTLADDYQIPYVTVAMICRLDRNTVSKLAQTKRLLGLRYIFANDKGRRRRGRSLMRLSRSSIKRSKTSRRSPMPRSSPGSKKPE